ncbi:hypothetical protein PQ610_00755 [Tardisphaera miroshnichenkoae]
MRKPALFFLLVLLIGLGQPATLASAESRDLSGASILGYFPSDNPKSASWYLSRYSSDFSAFFYEGVPVGQLSTIYEVDKLAAQFTNVEFYVGLVVPSNDDLFNSSVMAQVESELDQSVRALNQSNIIGVQISALYAGAFALPWTSHPSKAELQDWYSWLSENGLPKIPFAPNGTVYVPIFAQWTVNASCELAKQLINSAREANPRLEYGIAQYDSNDLGLDITPSLYNAVVSVRPNFTLTQSMALAVSYESQSYPYYFVLYSLPMAPAYRASLGELWVDDSFAALTSTSGDNPSTATFKFTLNELSTYLSGETPVIGMEFEGPGEGYVPLQEYALDPALALTGLPKPSNASAPVLVIRPTYAIGSFASNSDYQRQLFYALVFHGVPFDCVSEAYVYYDPGVVDAYKYVIYASQEITPQMNFILGQDHRSIKVGLTSTYVGQLFSRQKGSASLPFNVTVSDFSWSSLSFLPTVSERGSYGVSFGNNTLSWNGTSLYLNGEPVSVTAKDYLGLAYYLNLYLDVALAAGAVVIVIFIASLVRVMRRRRRLRELLGSSPQKSRSKTRAFGALTRVNLKCRAFLTGCP